MNKQKTLFVHTDTWIHITKGLRLDIDKALPISAAAIAKALRAYVRVQCMGPAYDPGQYEWDDTKIWALSQTNVLSQDPDHITLLKAAAVLDGDNSREF